MTTNNSVNSPLSGTTGSGNFVGSSTPSITTPKIITAIEDTNGNNLIGIVATVSAVNYFQFLNNTASSSPAISAIGSDTNITLQLNGKGTGGVYLVGTSTNDNVVAGGIGEFVSSVIASGSAVTLNNSTATNITSISLTAGDWDVWGNVSWTAVQGTNSQVYAWVSSSSATLPDASLRNSITGPAASTISVCGISAPMLRFSISTTTTIFLSAEAVATSGTSSACGAIYARRRR